MVPINRQCNTFILRYNISIIIVIITFLFTLTLEEKNQGYNCLFVFLTLLTRLQLYSKLCQTTNIVSDKTLLLLLLACIRYSIEGKLEHFAHY